jgi:hypothetical protein
MRFIPMSVSEQCDLERKMLERFELLPPEWRTAPANRTILSTKQLPKRAAQALTISQAFFRIAELPDAPVDAKEMELAIRYQLGFGFWAWFFFKNFAIPIIQYLWKRYHDPDPVGSPAR